MREEYRVSRACTVVPDEELLQRTRERIEGRRRPAGWIRMAAVAACLGLVLLAAAALPGLLSPQGLEPAVPVSPSETVPAERTLPPTPGADPTGAPVQDEDRVLAGKLESLDLQEAYGAEKMGALLPRTPLQGYGFEEAGLFTGEDGSKSLHCTWTRGLTYLTVTVRPATEEDRKRLVPAGEEELYDITPYEIPLADTVPKKLWETVTDPVFQAEELSPRVLALRIFSRGADAGDEGEYTANFSLLCGDLLVGYSAKGQDLSGLYEAATSADWFQG